MCTLYCAIWELVFYFGFSIEQMLFNMPKHGPVIGAFIEPAIIDLVSVGQWRQVVSKDISLFCNRSSNLFVHSFLFTHPAIQELCLLTSDGSNYNNESIMVGGPRFLFPKTWETDA